MGWGDARFWFLITHGVFDIAIMAVLIWRFVNSGGPAFVRKAARAIASGAWSALTEPMVWLAGGDERRTPATRSAVSIAVDDAINCQRVRLAKAFNLFFAATTFLWLAMDSGKFKNTGAYFGYLSQIIAMVGFCKPGLFHQRTLWTWHIAYMVCLCGLNSPVSVDPTFIVLMLRTPTHLCAICVGMFCPSLILVAWTNFWMAAVLTWSCFSSEVLMEKVSGSSFVMEEACMLFFKLLFVWGVEALVRPSGEPGILSIFDD